MESKFSQFLKSSLFNCTQRLVIVCVFLFYATSVVGNIYYSGMTVKVATNSTGKGKVWVTNIENNTPTEDAYSIEKSFNQSNGKQSHDYFLYALASEGYYHAGWSTSESGIQVKDNSATGTTVFKEQVTDISTSSSSITQFTRWAVFKEQSVHKDYTRVVAILVDLDGKPITENETYVKDGGYVNVGAAATDQVDVVWGSTCLLYTSPSPRDS